MESEPTPAIVIENYRGFFLLEHVKPRCFSIARSDFQSVEGMYRDLLRAKYATIELAKGGIDTFATRYAKDFTELGGI